jgi:hypothetical protein
MAASVRNTTSDPDAWMLPGHPNKLQLRNIP